MRAHKEQSQPLETVDLPLLPPAWEWTSLGSLIVEIETGHSFKCEERPPRNDEIGVLKVSAVTWGEYDEAESKTCTDPRRIDPSLFVRPGDFLFSRANTIELVGACTIAGVVAKRLMLSDKILRFRFPARLDPRWALHFLRSRHGRREIERLASGNQESMRNIGQDRIRAIRVPIAPAGEQVRIVSALEQQLSRIDAGVAALARAKANLERYRASVLKAACEGRLVPTEAELARAEGRTYESASELLARTLKERRKRWEAEQLVRMNARGKPPKDDAWKKKYPEPAAPDTSALSDLPEGWSWASLGQLSIIQGGIQKQPSRTPVLNSFPFLRVANVFRGRLDLADIHQIELFDGELEKLRLEPGDLLIVEGNGSSSEIGRLAIWDGSIPDCVHQNHIIRARLVGNLRAGFIAAYWNSPVGAAEVLKLAGSTSGLYTLSVAKVSQLPVPLAPVAEQTRIVAEVDRRVSAHDRCGIDVAALSSRSSRLRQSLLAHAFSGKLVPQDPTDEPASALLEHVRKEREAKLDDRRAEKPAPRGSGRRAKEPAGREKTRKEKLGEKHNEKRDEKRAKRPTPARKVRKPRVRI